MGFLKGVASVIISVLLFLSLLAGGVCLTLGMSLKYENVQPTVTNLSTTLIPQNIDLNDSVEEEINNFYYKDYNCKLVKCIEEGEITVLISEKARSYWMSKFYMFLVISIVFVVLLFILTESIASWFFLIGSLIIIDSLIISKLNKIGTWVAKVFLTSIKEIFSGETPQEIITQIVGLFFTESRGVFYIMLGAGMAFIVLGIIFYLFKVGFKINYVLEKVKDDKKDSDDIKEEKISKKEVKNIVKESKEDVKSQVKEEIKQEVKEELKQEIKQEIKDTGKKLKQSTKKASKKRISSY